MPRVITKETEDLISQAQIFRKAGWTERQIAANLGVSQKTINNWLKITQCIATQSYSKLSNYSFEIASENLNSFYHGDCLFVMNYDIAPDSIDLIYLDPPFFTGKVRKGEIWQPEAMEVSFEDSESFWEEKGMSSHAPEWMKHIAINRPDFAAYLYYMMERLVACHKVLKQTGSMYLHCDWRASHYLKMILDEIFGCAHLKNEIIWHYTGGGRSKRYFSTKHDSIFYYTKTDDYIFNIDNIRIPYKDSSGYAKSGIKSKNGKVYLPNPNGTPVDDVWDIPIINPLSSERVGYPTQKPMALLERITLTSSNEGDIVLDPFCGCGTAIIAALKLNRRWIGIDINSTAYDITKIRIGVEETEEKQMPLGQKQDFAKAVYICRDLKSAKFLSPNKFESWANQYYKAIKPSPDNGVDGITRDGIPIQAKTFTINYAVISQFLTDARYHPNTSKPIKKLIIVSQKGFDDSARKRKYEIETYENVAVVLATPDDMLKIDKES